MKRILLLTTLFCSSYLIHADQVFRGAPSMPVQQQASLHYQHVKYNSQAQAASYIAARYMVLNSQNYAIKNAFLAQVREHVGIIDKALSDSVEHIFELLGLQFNLEARVPILGTIDKSNAHVLEDLEHTLSYPCRELVYNLQKIVLDKQGRFKGTLTDREREKFAYAVAHYLKQILDRKEYMSRIEKYAEVGVVGFEKIYRIEKGEARLAEKLIFHALPSIRALGNSFKKGSDLKKKFSDNSFNKDVRCAVALCKEKRIDEARAILSHYEKIRDESLFSKSRGKKHKSEENCQTLNAIISRHAGFDSSSALSAKDDVFDCVSRLELSLESKQIFEKLGIDSHEFDVFSGTDSQNHAHKEIIRLVNDVSMLLQEAHDVHEEAFLLGLFDNAIAAYNLNKQNEFASFSDIVDDILMSSKVVKKYHPERYHILRNKEFQDAALKDASDQTADLALLVFDSYMGSMNRTAEEQQARCWKDFNTFRRYGKNFPELSQVRFDELAFNIFLPALRFHESIASGRWLTRQLEIERFLNRRELIQFDADVYAEQHALVQDIVSDYMVKAYEAFDAHDMQTYDRYMARAQAWFDSDVGHQNLYKHSFSLSHAAQQLLHEAGYNPQRFIEIEGSPLQMQLQHEIVDIIEQTADLLQQQELQSADLFQKTIVDFVDLASCYNEAGYLYEGNRIVDVCWGAVDCVRAAGKGVIDGTLATADYIVNHPFEVTAAAVAPKAVGLYKLSQLLYGTGELGYHYTYDSPDQWHAYIEPFKKLSEHFVDVQGNLDIPQSVKAGSQLATQYYLGMKLYKCLDNFYDGAQRGVQALAQKYNTPKAEQAFVTPDGRLIKATHDNLLKNSSLSKPQGKAAPSSFFKKSRKASNVNSQKNLDRKLRALQKAQKEAIKTIKFSDGRIRYYDPEKASATPGPTRGAAYVTEYNTKTGQVRSWLECYDHVGNVNRVHPKMIDGQELIGQHYPPTRKEIEAFFKKIKE